MRKEWCCKVASWIFVCMAVISFTMGTVIGGLQTSIHYSTFLAGTRGVTLELVYVVFFFWCCWLLASASYYLSGVLLKYRPATGLTVGILVMTVHLTLVGLVFYEIGWI